MGNEADEVSVRTSPPTEFHSFLASLGLLRSLVSKLKLKLISFRVITTAESASCGDFVARNDCRKYQQ
ncbi:hypothetical protein EAF07_00210 [Streptococcus hillyeri]|uniref:Uncharacterized protein n=1 Tax=Streptococcus hillyeri TaxID=2282420 RepID=A0A3L9E172_9STRE|nr:hypothetical protein EAF07_00210 [Streptococcus hillyeri]